MVKFQEDDYGDEIWEESEPTAKDDIRVRYHYNTEEWYDALSFLGTSVILIPFDEDDLTEFDVDALGRVFGYYTSDYEDLKENVGSMQMGSDRQGDIDILKMVFPSLGASITKMLKEKNLEEENVTYLLYNEKNPVQRGAFRPEKSPRYLGHDIGHIEIDYGEDYEFKSMVHNYLSEASKFYFKEDEDGNLQETLYDYIIEQGYDDEYIEDESWYEIIGQFFDTYSVESDELYDIFGDLLAGNHDIDPPDTIYYKNRTFIKAENDKELMAMSDPFIAELTAYVKGDSAPLSHDKGSVILYDI